MTGRKESTPEAARVVMFSGGVGSWATAKRVADYYGTDHLTLLFADTLVEDEDTYRFLREGAANVGGELVTVKDGRTPFEVFHDDRFLGNARLANCSKFLKQKPCRDWLEANCDPNATVLYVGIDWAETHRIPAITAGWVPYRVEFPMTNRPYLDKLKMIERLKAEGIAPPGDYGVGLPHANCGAQGCVRGGQAYWRTLLRERRDVYLQSEADELDLRDYLQADVSILKDRAGGDTRPLTLKDFRLRLEAAPSLFDEQEWGACGCFTDAEPAGLRKAA